MKIVHALPPNFAQIVAAFPGAANPDVIFAYGDVMYRPSGEAIPQPVICHEEVHGAQQREIGVEHWWNQYIAEPRFRFDQELEAHKAEFIEAMKEPHYTQKRRKEILGYIATRLASALYGNMCSIPEAVKLISPQSDQAIMEAIEKRQRKLTKRAKIEGATP